MTGSLDWTATQWIAVYAALVATAGMAWNVYKDGFRDRERLKVRVGMRDIYGGGRPEHDIIAYTITNVGGRPIYLTHVAGDYEDGHSFFVSDPELPKKLEPGQYHMSLCKQYDGIAKGVKTLYVVNSLGRRYDAPKSDVAELKGNLTKLAGQGITRSWVGDRQHEMPK